MKAQFKSDINPALSRSIILTCIVLGLSACSDSNKPKTTTNPSEPAFNANLFSSESSFIDNSFFPLTPGKIHIYEGDDERVEVSVSHDTRMVDGVESAIVVDRAYEGGELVEETFDWYAQDMNGNVWYMGEESKEYENGVAINSAGSWESGKDIDGVGQLATAGIIMKVGPYTVGDTYQQEFYPTVAEDMAEIIAQNVTISGLSVETEDESIVTSFNTMQFKEWVPLDPDPVSTEEYKYFASGIGLVQETDTSGGEAVNLVEISDDIMPKINASDFTNPTVIDNPFFPLVAGTSQRYETVVGGDTELIIVDVLNTTRVVMGVNAVVVRDRVYINGDETTGILIEDTDDWFAQDDDGNVWYMGEEVDNYDEFGVFLDNEGAWEAGVDGAKPGILMKAEPRVGDSYRQEYYEGEAEDLATLVESEVSITLDNGSTYSTLRSKEWTPLEADSVEYKYYAPGVGFVREEKLDENGVVEEAIELI